MSAHVIAQAPDELKRTEFFAGYSNGQSGDVGTTEGSFTGLRPTTQHGFNLSGVYNLTRYFGIKGDFSATYKDQDITSTSTGDAGTQTIRYRANTSLYNFLGGVQFKDNGSTRRLKPFAHALVGVGHRRIGFSDFECTPDQVCAAVVSGETGRTGLAGAFGGGLDITIKKRIQFRMIQADYNPVRVFGRTEHNARFGAGIVF